LLGEGIGLVFTDRDGGVSPAPYETLNLAFHTGDDPANVLENRMLVARGLKMHPGRFIYLEQVHGLHVSRASSKDAGAKAGLFSSALPAADGVYTTTEGIALTVLTADCVPVAIAFPSAGAVAMVHAGWKGTIGNIVSVVLREMCKKLELDVGDARAVLGPAIAPCCYEVDEGRARLFVERYGKRSEVMTGATGRYLDLFRANTLNLVEAGVKEKNIRRAGGCTCCERRYFSYRRDGMTGRQGAYIFMR
jgi:YfiH family protein